MESNQLKTQTYLFGHYPNGRGQEWQAYGGYQSIKTQINAVDGNRNTRKVYHGVY